MPRGKQRSLPFVNRDRRIFPAANTDSTRMSVFCPHGSIPPRRFGPAHVEGDEEVNPARHHKVHVSSDLVLVEEQVADLREACRKDAHKPRNENGRVVLQGVWR